VRDWSGPLRLIVRPGGGLVFSSQIAESSCSGKVNSFQVGPDDPCALEVCPVKARALQVRTLQIGPAEVRALEVGLEDICAREVGSAEVRALEVGPPEVRAPQVSPASGRGDYLLGAAVPAAEQARRDVEAPP
jgi:hypothetical protein